MLANNVVLRSTPSSIKWRILPSLFRRPSLNKRLTLRDAIHSKKRLTPCQHATCCFFISFPWRNPNRRRVRLPFQGLRRSLQNVGSASIRLRQREWSLVGRSLPWRTPNSRRQWNPFFLQSAIGSAAGHKRSILSLPPQPRLLASQVLSQELCAYQRWSCWLLKHDGWWLDLPLGLLVLPRWPSCGENIIALCS
jgi:hypothetical protein